MRPTSTTVALCLLVASYGVPARADVPATLDKVRTSGSMTIAYRESSIPFS